MRVSEIRVKQIRVNQGLGVHLCLGFENLKTQVDFSFLFGRHRKPRIAPRNSSDLRFPFSYSSFLLRFSPTMQTMDCLNLPVKCTNSHYVTEKNEDLFDKLTYPKVRRL